MLPWLLCVHEEFSIQMVEDDEVGDYDFIPDAFIKSKSCVFN